jgi:hypothetical protein
MLNIPTNAVPSQTLSATLGGQSSRLNLYQKTTGLFLDLYVNDAPIIGGVVCQHGNKIVRDDYLGFVGDLVLFDTQGTSDPVYTGLGSRWQLFYIEAQDVII